MKEMEQIFQFVSEVCSELRKRGIKAGPSEEIDAIAALGIVPFRDAVSLKIVLNCTLIKNRQTEETESLRFPDYRSTASNAEFSSGRGTESLFGMKKMQIYSAFGIQRSDSLERPNPALVKKARISLKLLLREYGSSKGRRLIVSKSGRINIRKSLRSSVSSGWLYKLLRTRKKKTSSKLLLVLDVSGSMRQYRERLLCMMHASLSIGANTFLFSTTLVRLKERQGIEGLWSGTRIASSLSLLSKKYNNLIKKDTVLVIVSDGCDFGSSSELEITLQTIRKNSRGIVWVNPLADSSNYRPETECMRVASRYADRIVGTDAFLEPRKLSNYFKASQTFS